MNPYGQKSWIVGL